MTKRFVLMGGGLDSAAVALSLALARKEADLIWFNYGQKASAQELKAVQSLGRIFQMPVHVLSTDLGFSRARIMKGAEQAADQDNAALNVLELRNPVLLTQAASFVASMHVGERINLYVGFHKEPKDSAFNDAKVDYLPDLVTALNRALSGVNTELRIRTPLAKYERSEIFKFCLEKAPALLQRIYSCYEPVPCGVCAHCQQLKAYSEQAGVELDKEFDDYVPLFRTEPDVPAELVKS